MSKLRGLRGLEEPGRVVGREHHRDPALEEGAQHAREQDLQTSGAEEFEIEHLKRSSDTLKRFLWIIRLTFERLKRL